MIEVRMLEEEELVQFYIGCLQTPKNMEGGDFRW